ncbi:MAG: YegS/Rv2252/BmrU family lipid kinase [Defluviitaleaceae bacterium]|nr:YegS/Rv2252/BmrU family lipid kinase [Defluviitaleaceae bacterium]
MYHIIHNPYANRGGSLRYKGAFIELLDSHNLPYKLHSTIEPGDATKITKELIASGVKHIISLGGDGTFHECLNGFALGDDVTFGILPAGTGNDVSKMLSLPAGFENVRTAAKPILDELIKPIDYMYEANTGKQSPLFFSYGIAAQMVMAMDTYATRTRASYYKSIISLVSRLKPHTYQYSIDDGPMQTVKADFLGMHNCIHGGGGMVLVHDALIDDGLAEVFVVEHMGMGRRYRNLAALMTKKIHKQPNVKIIKAKKLTIHSPEDNLCCVDGEILNTNHLDLTVIPKGIKIFGK